MKNYIKTISFIFIFTVTFQTIQAQDNPDHPLLSRFAGSEMIAQHTIEYDAIRLPAGPIQDDNLPEEILELEGRITWISYESPENKSELEIARNYEAALDDGGFDILFSCAGSECGAINRMYGWLFSTAFNSSADPVFNHQDHTRSASYGDRTRLFLATRTDEETTSHILLYIGEHRYRRQANRGIRYIGQVVVEGEPMQIGQVEAGVRDASELQEALDAEGRAVVEGIFFEYDSDEILPESAEALEQMALLLSNESGINVLIVGHTDNQGSFDYNLSLSERRAVAVRQALINDHGINDSRMRALGVGFAAPVASNNTEEGQAENRRVELVLQ